MPERLPNPPSTRLPAGSCDFLSGHVGQRPDGTWVAGRLGENLTTVQGYEVARITGLNVLGGIRQAVGLLDRLAAIVRGADTARMDLAPEAAGLLAASLGLSRMYADDLEQLDAGMVLYDAFHRWARDATDETHNWPAKPVRP